jgi:FkbM family methyltransferase
MEALAPYSGLVACEPDPLEATRLSEALVSSAPWRFVTVVPKALSGREGTRKLYMTRQPGLSSLLRPDEAVTSRYWFADAFEVQSVEQVDVMTLDAAAAEYGFADACFLKLDTQGTELEILQSGERLLDSSVQGIYIETNFQAFYREQPLFADVDTFLRARGFGLVDLRPTLQRGADHLRDRYSRRQVVWAHCLYLRDVRAAAGALEGQESTTAAARWLCIALAYEHNDLARTFLARTDVAQRLQETFGQDLLAELDQLTVRSTRRRLRKHVGDPSDLLGPAARG